MFHFFFFQTWKTRWFTLHRNELKYFKDQMVRNMIIYFPFKNELSKQKEHLPLKSLKFIGNIYKWPEFLIPGMSRAFSNKWDLYKQTLFSLWLTSSPLGHATPMFRAVGFFFYHVGWTVSAAAFSSIKNMSIYQV